MTEAERMADALEVAYRLWLRDPIVPYYKHLALAALAFTRVEPATFDHQAWEYTAW